MKSGLKNKNEDLKDFFGIQVAKFETIIGNKTETVERPVVFCKDINSLIEFIVAKRKLSAFRTQIGMDGGGGFVKICLTLASSKSDEIESVPIKCNQAKWKYENGVAANQHKDTSVKRLIIIGICPNVQENYSNMDTLWTMVGLGNINSTPTISTDLKLANIISGIMSHSSTFPCRYCEAQSGQLEAFGKTRTIGSISDLAKKWQQEGATKKDAKFYKNCINLPLPKGTANTKIVDVVTPPELHLLLGTVNTIWKSLYGCAPVTASSWATKCSVVREGLHGGEFKGNSCKILLNRIDELECIAKNNTDFAVMKYVRVFRDFKKVVEACFGASLHVNYKEIIDNFKISYLQLGINVTPKLHMIFHHVAEFCDKNGIGLGKYSEQASESVHFDFSAMWAKYKVQLSHIDYNNKLLKSVIEYNSRHV